MSRYASTHFGRTAASLKAVVPEKLIHRAVQDTGADRLFSDERRHAVFVADLPSSVVSLTIGCLDPGQATRKHRHTYETILFVLEGEGTTVVENVEIRWTSGDAVYIPTWAWHWHTNASAQSPCRYVACENAPMLQNLGLAVREEST
jgi:quercetin dioxygenase-like cupin family protein